MISEEQCNHYISRWETDQQLFVDEVGCILMAETCAYGKLLLITSNIILLMSFGLFHFVMKFMKSIVWESLGQRPEEFCDVDSSEMFWKGTGNQNYTYEKNTSDILREPQKVCGLC